jgi:hypothetical protein
MPPREQAVEWIELAAPRWPRAPYGKTHAVNKLRHRQGVDLTRRILVQVICVVRVAVRKPERLRLDLDDVDEVLMLENERVQGVTIRETDA